MDPPGPDPSGNIVVRLFIGRQVKHKHTRSHYCSDIMVKKANMNPKELFDVYLRAYFILENYFWYELAFQQEVFADKIQNV